MHTMVASLAPVLMVKVKEARLNNTDRLNSTKGSTHVVGGEKRLAK